MANEQERPLNIYAVAPSDDEYGGYEWHVVAPTRGKARAIFIGYGDDFLCGYEWTDKISIRLLEKNVDLREGVDENFKWARRHPGRYSPEFFPENNPEFM